MKTMLRNGSNVLFQQDTRGVCILFIENISKSISVYLWVILKTVKPTLWGTPNIYSSSINFKNMYEADFVYSRWHLGKLSWKILNKNCVIVFNDLLWQESDSISMWSRVDVQMKCNAWFHSQHSTTLSPDKYTALSSLVERLQFPV